MSKNLAEFLATYAEGTDRVILDTIVEPTDEQAGRYSPFIVLRDQLGHVAVVNPMALDGHLCIDIHSFKDGDDATAGVFGMSDGARFVLEHSGTTSHGWPSADLVACIIGAQADAGIRPDPLAPVAEFLAKRLTYEDPTEYEGWDPFNPDFSNGTGERMLEGSGADHASVLYQLLTWLQKRGHTAVTDPMDRYTEFSIRYEIRTNIDGSVVGSGEKVVLATSEESAVEEVVEWVHDNDPKADSRVDPMVECFIR